MFLKITLKILTAELFIYSGINIISISATKVDELNAYLEYNNFKTI